MKYVPKINRKLLPWLGLLAASALYAGAAMAQPIGNPSPGSVTTNVVIDTTAINDATCWILYFTEGMFGALLLAVTGIGALVSAAVGAHRSALNCLIVAAGAFLIHPTAEMFFSDKNTPVIDCTNVFTKSAPTIPTP